jgi:D-arabinose 5-phosphate isomerase GutQ
MIEKNDVAILISNSGITKEVTDGLSFLKRIGCQKIAFTSGGDSLLAKGCDALILIPKLAEADHLNLAPTVSSTLTLVLGDAIACTLSELKEFKREDFYKFHPGGALGDMLSKDN